MTDPVESMHATIGAALGRIPSGLFILTARSDDGHETGMLASWVQQASFEPPMITVTVNRKRYLNEWLKKSPHLAVSIVGEGQKEFLKHFGAGFEPDQPAFEGMAVNRSPGGLPVLAEALGYLEGHVTGQMNTGDHVVYAVEITAAGAGPQLRTLEPRVHIRKNGFSY